MAKEYIIYCDESESKGRLFSNFYGGALVQSDHLDFVRKAIAAKKQELNLFGEIKWSKVTAAYYKKYIAIIDLYFDIIKDGKVKIRIMFTQNAARPRRLTADHINNQYAILYYYFIRHAFGLMYSSHQGVRIRIYPDRLPLKTESVKSFKQFILRLNNRSEFRSKLIKFSEHDITEVESHDHDILQCLDIVLGAMNFRLNKKHKDKPKGAHVRPERTRVKEKLYNHINKRIRDIYPHFNIGITTGHGGDKSNRWNHPYRHWNFRTSARWR